jgi:hypothetical protein
MPAVPAFRDATAMNRNELERFAQSWAAAVSRGSGFEELLADGVDSAPFTSRAAAMRSRLGPFEVLVDELVCEEDRAAWRWTLRARTGVLVRWVNFERIASGRLLEHWTCIEAVRLPEGAHA